MIAGMMSRIEQRRSRRRGADVKRIASMAGGLLLVVAAAGPARADDKVRVENLDLGPHWYGPRIEDKNKLVGNVVLFVLWGT
jgi:hypothetical protein